MGRFAHVFLLLLLLVHTACTGDSEPGGAAAAAVRDSAGIQIVENPAPATDALSTWALGNAPATDIGVLDGPPEYQLDEVTSAVRLSDGRIVIANNGSKELRFFDAEGRYLRSAGGAGEGPGEFQTIRGLYRLPGDSLLVWDARSKRVSVIGPHGEFARSFQPEGPTGMFPEIAAVLGDGSFYLGAGFDPARMAGLPDGELRDSVHFVRYDRTGAVVDTIGPLLGDEQFLLKTDNSFSFARPVFGRSLEIAAGPEHLYAGTTDEFQITQMSPAGAHERIIRMAHEPYTVTEDDLERYWENRSLTFSDAPADMRAMLERQAQEERERLPHRPTLPAYAGLHVDAEGHLWVRNTQPPGEQASVWSVFAPDGRWTAAAETPHRFRVTDIGSDWVLGVATDELDVQHVQLYTLGKERNG